MPELEVLLRNKMRSIVFTNVLNSKEKLPEVYCTHKYSFLSVYSFIEHFDVYDALIIVVQFQLFKIYRYDTLLPLLLCM
jgi:hypothetical protein